MLPAPAPRLLLTHRPRYPRRFRALAWSWLSRPRPTDFANQIYQTWLQDAVAKGWIEMPFVLHGPHLSGQETA